MDRVTPDPITAAQRNALAKLAPALVGCYLARGIAISARLGHRPSHDLDVFTATDPLERLQQIETIPGVIITSKAEGTIYCSVDGVPVSVLRCPYAMLSPPELVAGLSIPLASVDDLACMKLAAISSRGLARDFWDLSALLEVSGHSLAEHLAAFQRKYPAQDIGHVIRSLVYFGDAESQPMPIGLDAERWRAIRADLETRVSLLVRDP